jgi:hypothetical protein
MYQPKKQQVERFFCGAEVLPEILDDRALRIERHACQELDMRYGSRPVPYCIIAFGKNGIPEITFTCPVDGDKQTY